MAIQVSLCPEFPRKRPVLKVSPQIDHPWVSEQSEIIRAPGLVNVSGSFTKMLHSDSGYVWWHNSSFLCAVHYAL
jgi:ESCRT-I complex subunit VPS37